MAGRVVHDGEGLLVPVVVNLTSLNRQVEVSARIDTGWSGALIVPFEIGGEWAEIRASDYVTLGDGETQAPVWAYHLPIWIHGDAANSSVREVHVFKRRGTGQEALLGLQFLKDFDVLVERARRVRLSR